jgi:N-hydroxyarylamine O-acetyltransferase
MSFDRGRYLDRIGLDSVSMDSEGLMRLHEAQQTAIPFENIDPLLGRTPELGIEAIWRKLVDEKRGGYCFELNGLLQAALSDFGFEVGRRGARVRNGALHGGARVHLAFVVTIGRRRHLADAGFGGPGFRLPLSLETYEEQVQGHETFRIRDDESTGETVVEKKTHDGWFALYSFDDADYSDSDIETANFVCANWPKAPFPHHLMMNIRTPSGRVSLFNRDVTLSQDGTERRWTVQTAAELTSLLADLLKVEPAPADLHAVARRLGLEGPAPVD